MKKDLKLKDDVAKRIPSAFTVYGFDIFHIGAASLKTGALVGVPINFNYTYPIQNSDRKNIIVSLNKIYGCLAIVFAKLLFTRLVKRRFTGVLTMEWLWNLH